MNRKWKEIALLLVPVAALAAVVPGARWLADWRESNKVPRIESFELRAPTDWEAYNGAEVGYTSRMVAPPVDNSDSWMDTRLEFRNQQGKVWNTTQNADANSVIVASDDDTYTEGEPSVYTVRGGLKWKEMVGNGQSARVNVIFEEKLFQQTQSRASRAFKLESGNQFWQAPERARRANFEVDKVQLQTTPMSYGGEIKQELQVSILGLNEAPLNVNRRRTKEDNWEFRFDSQNQNTEIDFRELVVKPTTSKDNEIIGVEFFEKLHKFRGQPAHFSKFISINDGWPQEIRVELPRGLPAKPGTIKLPFTAQLAPLPKSQ